MHMDYEEVDIPPISGSRGKLTNYVGARKRDYKKIGNKRVRGAIRQALRTLQPFKAKAITAWDID